MLRDVHNDTRKSDNMRFAVRRVSNYFIDTELAGIPVETGGKDAREGVLDIKTLEELMAVVGIEGSAVIYSAERDRLPVIALADDWLDGC